MGQFAEVLHIRPWETRDLMTAGEFDALADYLRMRDEQIRKGAHSDG